MIDHVREDADRANELVVVGSRWFGWRHHWTVLEEKIGFYGVREVRFVRDDKPGVPSTDKRVRDNWLPAWRVQKFCDRAERTVEVSEADRTRSKRLALRDDKPAVRKPKRTTKRRKPVKNTPRTRKRTTAKRTTAKRKTASKK